MRLTITQNHNNWMTEQDRDKEASLLEIIQENSQLPQKENARYQYLLQKCENKTINLEELAEYQTLLRQLETRNLKRIDALMALAQIKGKRYGKLLSNQHQETLNILSGNS